MNDAELLDRWLEGGLEAEEHRSFERRLATDPAFARSAALAAGDRWNLRESLRAVKEDQLRSPSSRPRIVSLGRASSGSRPIRRRARRRSPGRRWFAPTVVATIAVVATLLIAFALVRDEVPVIEGERIVVVGGPADALGRTLAPEVAFEAHDDLVLGSAAGAFALEFVAGGRLRYHGGGDRPLVIDLVQGSLKAEVAKRPPTSPLVVRTPDAQLEVVGTGFTIAYRGDRTEVAVHEGVVRMRDLATGTVALVGAGDEWIAGDPEADPPVPAPAVDITVDAEGAVTALGPALGDLAMGDLPEQGRLPIGGTHTSSGTGRALMAALRAGEALSLVLDATVEKVPTGELFAAEVVIPRLEGGERAWDLFQLRVPAASVPRDAGRFALIWDGEELAVVVDGQLATSRQFNATTGNWTTPLQIKLAPDLGAGQEGIVRIHRLRIFDRALTPNELAALPGP